MELQLKKGDSSWWEVDEELCKYKFFITRGRVRDIFALFVIGLLYYISLIIVNYIYCINKLGKALKKSRIRETKHLSTDADSSTDAIGGWTKAKSATKKNFFARGDFRPLWNKNVQMLDHFFPLLFPKDSESLEVLDIRLWEVGAKRPLKGTSKVKNERIFFLRCDFRQFQTKMFISETTSFHYFSPRIPNL